MIDDIERGTITREILYRITYEDDEQEHLTAAQVQEFLEPTVVVTCHRSVETETDAILVTCMAPSGTVMGKFDCKHTDTVQVLAKKLSQHSRVSLNQLELSSIDGHIMFSGSRIGAGIDNDKDARGSHDGAHGPSSIARPQNEYNLHPLGASMDTRRYGRRQEREHRR